MPAKRARGWPESKPSPRETNLSNKKSNLVGSVEGVIQHWEEKVKELNDKQGRRCLRFVELVEKTCG